MNPITTFVATALVLFAIGQGIAAARADDVPPALIHATAGVAEADPVMLEGACEFKLAADLAASAASTSK